MVHQLLCGGRLHSRVQSTSTHARAPPCWCQALLGRVRVLLRATSRGTRAGSGGSPRQATQLERSREQGRGRGLDPSSILPPPEGRGGHDTGARERPEIPCRVQGLLDRMRAVDSFLGRRRPSREKTSPCARRLGNHVHSNPRRGDARCAAPSTGHVASGLILYPPSTGARRIVVPCPTAPLLSVALARAAQLGRRSRAT